MIAQAIPCECVPASVSVSRFQGESGVDEYHVVVHPSGYATTDAQLDWVFAAYRQALDSLGLDLGSAVVRRFFCSDLTNQAPALQARPFSNPDSVEVPCAVSWVCQPPMPPAKVAMWAYHVQDPREGLRKSRGGNTLTLHRAELAHHWTTGLTSPGSDGAYGQTRAILEHYDAFLQSQGLTLADHVVRTWFFVQDIDANYQGLVVARREFFDEHDLTAETHYIASTGIEGAHADVTAKVTLDAYAVSGLWPGQISYLSAPDHLSPTHVYGVTFERGTAVDYRDRRHVIISGTASIDRDGKILHLGDVSRQLDRTLENVEALLAQAGAGLSDVGMFVVYLRDPSDYELAWRRMRERFPGTPMAVAVARVCRPGWLIEVECLAAVSASHPRLPSF